MSRNRDGNLCIDVHLLVSCQMCDLIKYMCNKANLISKETTVKSTFKNQNLINWYYVSEM